MFCKGFHRIFILGSNAEDDFSMLNDSDNEQSEKCAICLSKFKGQDIATPETCDHMFCLECLQEWAKVRDIFILFIYLFF